MQGEIYQAANPEQLVDRAVKLLAAAGEAAVAARGRFVVALTGGRTVQPLYRQLASQSDPALRRLLTERTEYFWGDERLVPPDHPESNRGLARRLFLETLAVLPVHLHPVATAGGDPLAAARLYEQHLRDYFGTTLTPEGRPRFDLVLLGLGPDGHVASLFPGSPALAETAGWVAGVAEPGLPPPLPRVTLTLPLLNQARLVLLLVAGVERSRLARRIRAGDPATARLPAAGLHPAGQLVWLLSDTD